MNIIDNIEREQQRTDIPQFMPGDSVKLYVKVVEGGKERVQVYEGIVTRKSHGGLKETFTVRKISGGVGVERTFPIHSPMLEKIEVLRKGKVRRAKLYYLRERSGKSARIDERREE